ncbi:MAG: hypothetical protein Rubg2KO_41080 [Rubricoccaceae bacterium]
MVDPLLDEVLVQAAPVEGMLALEEPPTRVTRDEESFAKLSQDTSAHLQTPAGGDRVLSLLEQLEATGRSLAPELAQLLGDPRTGHA